MPRDTLPLQQFHCAITQLENAIVEHQTEDILTALLAVMGARSVAVVAGADPTMVARLSSRMLDAQRSAVALFETWRERSDQFAAAVVEAKSVSLAGTVGEVWR